MSAYRIMRRWPMLSTAGATKERKSEGVIHGGTASTPSIIPSESSSKPSIAVFASRSSCVGLAVPSRKTCMTPSGKFVEPDFFLVCGTKVASAGPER